MGGFLAGGGFGGGGGGSANLGQIYNWQQDVQANFHQILNLASVTFNIAGAANPMSVALNTSSQLVVVPPNGLSRLIIAQSGQTYIGVDSGNMATAGAKLASLVVTFPSDSTLTGQSVLYLYNGSVNCSLTIETGPGNQRSRILFITGSASLRYSIQTTGVSTSGGPTNSFYIANDFGTAPILLINSAGNIGIGLGTTSPTHQLQLSTDDAAKTTTSTWTTTSDIRTKRKVRPLEGGMKVIAALEPIEAEFNGNALTPEGSRVVSFDPEKLSKILPHSVSSVRAKLRSEDVEETDIQNVNIHEVIFHLILAVQQQEERIEALTRSHAANTARRASR